LTYDVQEKTIIWIPYHKTKTARLTEAERKENYAKQIEELKLEIQRQRLKVQQQQQFVATVLMGIFLLGFGICALTAWLTKKVWRYGVASVICLGIATVCATFSKVIAIVHSWWLVPLVVVLATSFFVLRKLSLKELWDRRKANKLKDPGNE